MKHSCLCAFITFLSFVARAQFDDFPTNEVTVGWGNYPMFQFLDKLPLSSYRDNYASGGYNISLKHNLTERVAFSAGFAFENEKGLWGPDGWGTFKRRCFTYAPEFWFNYVGSEHLVRLYLNVSVAFTYQNQIDIYDSAVYYRPGNYQNGVNELGPGMQSPSNMWQVNAYVSPIGVRVGREFGAFLQLGFGFKGIVSGGISYQFYKKDK